MSCNSNCVPFGRNNVVTLTFPTNCSGITSGSEPFNITVTRSGSGGGALYTISLINPKSGPITYQLRNREPIPVTGGARVIFVQPLPLNVNINQGPPSLQPTDCALINGSTITTVVLGPLSFGTTNPGNYRNGDTYVIELVGCCPDGPMARFTPGSNSTKFF